MSSCITAPGIFFCFNTYTPPSHYSMISIGFFRSQVNQSHSDLLPSLSIFRYRKGGMGDHFYQINFTFHLKMTISNRLFHKESFATQMKLIVNLVNLYNLHQN